MEVMAFPVVFGWSLSLRGIDPKSRTTRSAKTADRSVGSTLSAPHGVRDVYEFGLGRICLPFLVARILRRGMGQGAADLGRRMGVGCAVAVQGSFECGADPLRGPAPSLRMTVVLEAR